MRKLRKSKRIKLNNNSGFTLPELIVVILVILILSAVMVIAADPMAKYEDDRNNERFKGVNLILNAIKFNSFDNGGEFLDTVNALGKDGLAYQIGSGENCGMVCANGKVKLENNCVDLIRLIKEGYLSSIPFDPGMKGTGPERTGYYLVSHPNGLITVGSCGVEQGRQRSIIEIKVTN